jgi:predicted nucleotidyltransferase
MIPLRSAITKKILNYFFVNPHESLYVNELSRKLELDKRNLVKKVRELEREGILIHQARGNLKLYSINTRYPLYNEFRKIIMSTVGVEDQLRRLLGKTGGVTEAYIYGSYAKDAMNAHSDIDVLVVGNLNGIAIQKSIGKMQHSFDREMNVTVMDPSDFKRRVKQKDPFISGIFKQKLIKVI